MANRRSPRRGVDPIFTTVKPVCAKCGASGREWVEVGIDAPRVVCLGCHDTSPPRYTLGEIKRRRARLWGVSTSQVKAVPTASGGWIVSLRA